MDVTYIKVWFKEVLLAIELCLVGVITRGARRIEAAVVVVVGVVGVIVSFDSFAVSLEPWVCL